MKIAEHIHIVASGRAGFSLTNPADCHVYHLSTAGGGVLVDAGVGLETGRILDVMNSDGLDPAGITAILLTHVHSDHAGGAAELQTQLGADVYVPSAESHLVRSGDEEGLGLVMAKADDIYPAEYSFPVFEPDRELSGGEVLRIGELSIEVIHTPGHSPGSLCYLTTIGDARCLFSGDVVVHGGKLMFLNCPGTTMKDYRESVPKLAGRAIDRLFPGHGCFVMENGQDHIDTAIDALSHLVPPPNAL